MNQEDVDQVRQVVPDATIIISHMDAVNHAYLSRKDYMQRKTVMHDEMMLIPLDGETVTI